MGWFSNLLLPGRLRTGPTVLLPARPDPKTLLAIAQLADPAARPDGDGILAGGSRILPAVELGVDMLAKLGVEGEERLWACRIAAEGPLPVDFFDKTLAEGIAYRLGGWSLCQGEPTDPVEDERRYPVVYLPAAPTPEETLPVLAGLLRPVNELDSARWPDGELVDGIVHVAIRQGRVTDVYAGADTVVTVEEGHRVPPAVGVRWPYLTEVAVLRVSPLPPRPPAEAVEVADVDARAVEDLEAAGEHGQRDGTADDEATATAQDGATVDGATVDGAALDGAGGGPESDETEEPEEPSEEASGEASEDEDDLAYGPETGSADAEEAMLARATLALTLADRLQGIAADSGAFQLGEAEDVLPGRYA
ncbi:hypothetical protein [Microbispora sp. ATCC PTA-5024]|uniref:hypothetical protein n=1 Tax=Microbispora sp. ATCC PTA-5024 TaxID=316330 RepID=UPI0003DBB3CB|nr:hypothetical protein [Microbispora sp. ATCC PTA-5024]ETK33096.1 hypothetical protein MPTA5024_26205 [Microbispora sp. ATCC PTA-5024]